MTRWSAAALAILVLVLCAACDSKCDAPPARAEGSIAPTPEPRREPVSIEIAYGSKIGYLRGRPVQERALSYGFRPADTSVPLKTAASTNPFTRLSQHGVKIEIPPDQPPAAGEQDDLMKQLGAPPETSPPGAPAADEPAPTPEDKANDDLLKQLGGGKK